MLQGTIHTGRQHKLHTQLSLRIQQLQATLGCMDRAQHTSHTLLHLHLLAILYQLLGVGIQHPLPQQLRIQLIVGTQAILLQPPLLQQRTPTLQQVLWL